MKTQKLLVLVCSICFSFLMSCSADESLSGSNVHDQDAVTRASGNMTIEITKLDRSTVSLTIASASFTHTVGTGFTVVTNPGTFGAQTFSALEARVVEPDSDLKFTKNPGLNQTVWTDKEEAIIVDENDGLKATINPGNIVTTALSIIVDEIDGV